MIIGVFAMIVVLVLLDQLIKIWAVGSLQAVGSIPLIDGVFHLTYVENRGAVAGILQGKQILLIAVTAVFIGVLILGLLLKKIPGKWMPWVAGLIVGGGIGNLIDRVFRGFVVDYLDFRLIHYPVFNFADCCVVVGVIAYVIYLVFFEGKEERKAAAKPAEDLSELSAEEDEG